MPGYDRQLILQFLTGAPDDGPIRAGADVQNRKALANGQRSVSCEVPTFGGGRTPMNDRRFREMAGELKQLTTESRLYLIGHGDWKKQTIAGWPPEMAAGLIGPHMPSVKVISLIACGLAADKGAADDVRVATTCDSFAGKFHAALKGYGVLSDVLARIWNLSHVTQIKDYLGRPVALPDDDPRLGRKFVSPQGAGWAHKLSESKIRFSWDGGGQKREWAY